MVKEKFKIDKAYQLCLIYRKRRQYAKENLISQIILWYDLEQDFTLESTISVIGHFQCKTVQAVCNDLGYRLGFMKYDSIKGLDGKKCVSYTRFLFLSHIEYFESY